MDGLLSQFMPQGEGLLGRIGRGIQNVASSPIAQGAGTAALFGFNPLLGLAAAPAIAAGQERSNTRRELVRRELEMLQRREQGQGAVSDLIAMLGQGEGQAAPLNPLQTQFLQAANDLSPATAVQQLGGLLGFGQQERAEPSILRELDALGLPRNVDGIAALARAKQAGSADDNALRDTLLALQVAERQRLAEQEERTEAQRRRSLRVQTRSTFRKVQELAALTERLQSTALETGNPFNQLMRDVIAGGAPVLERFGFDGARARQTVTDFDRFNKLTTELQLDAAALEGSNAGTNTRFQAVRDSMASIGTAPGAIPPILADVTKTLLDAAEIEGIDVDSADEMRAFIEQMGTGRAASEQRRFRFDPASQELVPR